MPHLSPRKASTVVIVAIVLTVLVGFAALAVDFSYQRVVQLQAQNAADAAAYGAMVALRDSQDEGEAFAIGEAIGARHTVGGYPADVTVSIGTWDFDNDSWSEGGGSPNAVRAYVERSASQAGGDFSFFGKALDYQMHDVTADAVAAIQPRDILFIMDQSGSMYQTMGYAKEGLLTAIEIIAESDPNGTDRVGMVGFSEGGYVHIPMTTASLNFTELYDEVNQELCICGYDNYSQYYDRQWAGDLWNDPDDPSDDVQHDWQTRRHHPVKKGRRYGYGGSAHANLAAPCCWPYCETSNSGGTTNTAGAVETAVDHMLENARPTAYKLIVFLGDGMPNCSWTRYRAGQCSGTGSVISQTDQHLDRGWDNHIHTTTMFYSSYTNSTAIARFESWTRGDGRALNTTDKRELEEMFERAVRTNVALVE